MVNLGRRLANKAMGSFSYLPRCQQHSCHWLRFHAVSFTPSYHDKGGSQGPQPGRRNIPTDAALFASCLQVGVQPPLFLLHPIFSKSNRTCLGKQFTGIRSTCSSQRIIRIIQVKYLRLWEVITPWVSVNRCAVSVLSPMMKLNENRERERDNSPLTAFCGDGWGKCCTHALTHRLY